MIRYPEDIKDETLAAAEEFYSSLDESFDNMSDEEISKKADEYVYNHVSDKAKAFLDDLKAIYEYADKHGLKV